MICWLVASPAGPELGRLLDAVRREWQESDFTLDRAACLARLDQLLAQPGRDLTP